jgi:hypothetical protein
MKREINGDIMKGGMKYIGRGSRDGGLSRHMIWSSAVAVGGGDDVDVVTDESGILEFEERAGEKKFLKEGGSLGRVVGGVGGRALGVATVAAAVWLLQLLPPSLLAVAVQLPNMLIKGAFFATICS